MDAPILDRRRGTVQERVARRLPVEFTDECFEWTGKRNAIGYGLIRAGGKDEPDIRVTHVVFEMFNGPIPEGHRLIRHSCHNPPCVNPRHLISGTDADNMRDKALSGRAARKLTADDVRAIRAEPMGGAHLAQKYGVSSACVKAIRARRTWRWLD